jgi:hypothetical protein
MQCFDFGIEMVAICVDDCLAIGREIETDTMIYDLKNCDFNGK